MTEEENKLSRLDRYFLSNQLRILEALYPNEANEIAVQREAIERGYEMLYDLGTQHIYDGEDVMTAEESSEVWDTLDMFDALTKSATPEQMENTRSTFSGYDGNNETKFMAFTAFTVERLERFEYVKLAKKGYYNSHMPMREQYRNMLLKWKELPREKQHQLSEDDVTNILSTAPFQKD